MTNVCALCCVSSVASKRKTSVLPNRRKKIIQNEKRKASTGKMEKTKKIFICCGLKTETETILVCVVSYFKRSRCVSSYLLRITTCFHRIQYSSILRAMDSHTRHTPATRGTPSRAIFQKTKTGGFCVHITSYNFRQDKIFRIRNRQFL